MNKNAAPQLANRGTQIYMSPKATGKSNNNTTGDSIELVQRILSGSTEAWHEFLDRYSGLIYGIVRRQLAAEDEDDVRSVYVDVLKQLYDRDLARYRDGSDLPTWLMVLAKRRAFDHLRARYGRIRKPAGFANLTDLEREVLRIYYVENASLEIVVHTLAWAGYSATADEVVTAIQQIEDTLDRRFLKRLQEEHRARKTGMGPASLLRYVIHQRIEFERQSRGVSPDAALMEKEASDAAKSIRTLISKLPGREREIIELRFGRGWTAKQISDALGLKGQRKAYSVIDRVIRKLKTLMEDGQLDGRL